MCKEIDWQSHSISGLTQFWACEICGAQVNPGPSVAFVDCFDPASRTTAHVAHVHCVKKKLNNIQLQPVDNVVQLDANRKSSANTFQVGGDHYKKMSIQPWDALRAWLTPDEFRGYMLGTAMVYLARNRVKGGIKDVKKAVHHLIKYLEGDGDSAGQETKSVADDQMEKFLARLLDQGGEAT